MNAARCQVAADLRTKLIILNHKPACRLPVNYIHHRLFASPLLLLSPKADTHFTAPWRVEGWVKVVSYIPRWFICSQMVTHPSTNWARCSLMCANKMTSDQFSLTNVTKKLKYKEKNWREGNEQCLVVIKFHCKLKLKPQTNRNNTNKPKHNIHKIKLLTYPQIRDNKTKVSQFGSIIVPGHEVEHIF